ncbi:MAG TPA: hypothetical protein VJH69_01250 [Candidatus Paceibacterota bacterium]
MKEDFLGELIDNRSRASLLRAFLFNESEPFSAEKIAKLAGLNIKKTAEEIKFLEKIGIIKKTKAPKTAKKGSEAPQYWIVNPEFKYLRALSSFIHAVFPIRYANIVKSLKDTGKLSAVIVSGCFMGDLTRPADIIIVGDNMNETRLDQAVRGLEPLFGREIRYASFLTPEFQYRLTIQDRLIRDTLDYPHLVLFDRARML